MQEAKRDRGRAREVNAVLGRGRVRPWKKGAPVRTGRSGNSCFPRKPKPRHGGGRDGDDDDEAHCLNA